MTQRPQNSLVLLRFHTKQSEVKDELVQAFGIENATVEKRSRDELRAVNEKRVLDAKKQGQQQVRAGMLGDTGVQVFGKNGLANVSLAEIHSDLLACGFILTRARVVQEPQVDQKRGQFTATNKQKWVIDARYELPEEGQQMNLPLLQRVEKYLSERKLSATVHVWDNPDGSGTINASSEQDGNPEVVNVLRYHPVHGFYKVEANSRPPVGVSLRQKRQHKIDSVAAKGTPEAEPTAS